MKYFLTCVFLWLITNTCLSGPADSGLTKTIKLPNGEVVTVRQIGDEFGSFLQDVSSDRCFAYNAEKGEYMLTPHALVESKMQSASRIGNETNVKRNAMGIAGKCEGEKKILTVLVDFPDKHFSQGNVEAFERILNEKNLSEGRYKGSVSDYFADQSMGKFIPVFDVVGLITLEHPSSYYGSNKADRLDYNHGEIPVEIYQKLKNIVDFNSYDWDEGEMTDVMLCVIFAGLAEELGGTEDDIWCKASWATVDTDVKFHYALSSEQRTVSGNVITNSIGTICHEMSHVFGLPDTYDGNGLFYGSQRWDVMGNGVHNENGFIPAGYTSLDRMLMGWQEPIELKNSTKVSNMQSLAAGGEFYKVTNDAFPTEFYLIENRQKTNVWDSSLPSAGVLIWHVDYSKYLFGYSVVNTSLNNPHERFALFLADNNGKSTTYKGDVYPYNGNNSLTNNSIPSAALWHANVDGTYLMNKPITDIYCDTDGNASFSFTNNVEMEAPAIQPTTIENEVPGLLAQYFFDFNIDNLKLSGSVNYRDIKFINEELKSLQRLDMSACYIQNGSTDTYGVLPVKAFFQNLSLVAVTLPSLQQMGTWAFAKCPNLTRVVIGEGLDTISYCAFYKDEKLEEVILPQTVTDIESYAFAYCQSLKSIKIPNSVLTINDYAFSKSLSLEHVDLPEQIEVLANSSFRDCNLRDIVIPANVKELKYAVFWGNKNVEEVVCKSEIPPVCEEFSFDNECYKKATLYVPEKSVNAYKGADTWKNFKKVSAIENYNAVGEISMDLPAGILSIDGRVLHFNASVKHNIVVSSINGARIYAGNKAIESLELPFPGVYIISINGRKSKIIVR